MAKNSSTQRKEEEVARSRHRRNIDHRVTKSCRIPPHETGVKGSKFPSWSPSHTLSVVFDPGGDEQRLGANLTYEESIESFGEHYGDNDDTDECVRECEVVADCFMRSSVSSNSMAIRQTKLFDPSPVPRVGVLKMEIVYVKLATRLKIVRFEYTLRRVY